MCINAYFKSYSLLCEEFSEKQGILFQYIEEEYPFNAIFSNEYKFCEKDILHDLITSKPKGHILLWYVTQSSAMRMKTWARKNTYFDYCGGHGIYAHTIHFKSKL